jgi:hypothetical protein
MKASDSRLKSKTPKHPVPGDCTKQDGSKSMASRCHETHLLFSSLFLNKKGSRVPY